MDCSDFKALMSLYVDGEIAPGDKTKFEKHLEICQQCKGELECFRLISEKVRSMGEKELPDGFHSELMNKIENMERKKSFFNIRTGYKFGTLAAGIAVIMVVVFADGNNLKNDGRIKNMIDGALPAQEYFSAGGAAMESALSDDAGAAMKEMARSPREKADEEIMPYAAMNEADSEKSVSDVVEEIEIRTAKADVAEESDRIIALADEIVFLDMNSNSLGAEGAHIIISVLESRKDYVIELIKDKNKKENSLPDDLSKDYQNNEYDPLVNINIDITVY